MGNASRNVRKTLATVRCAVYTRKSTEEGLEQEFNSLDAQREAAEAYIHSQRHQGWILLEEHYDDGGFSGGSLDRPALQRLMADIAAGRMDCVVVYKVDRLSRSLLDFARLMDQFDQHAVSFVAVTQPFNTTTSLGRLTLNVLLSFAQFEKDIIGERTRDKMSAARRKGKWIGGLPVLGYDVAPEGGRLVVNQSEAVKVRAIFELFREHRSLSAVREELERRQWVTKVWRSQRGIEHGGRPFGEPMLMRLLTNPVYTGRVQHHGEFYAGEHPAIVEPGIWQSVNAQLRSVASASRGTRGHGRRTAPLHGLLYCGECKQPMGATATAHHGRHYRYYVCRLRTCPSKAVAAAVIEESVRGQVRSALQGRSMRQQWGISDQQWEAFEGGDGELLRTIVRQICYSAQTGCVSLELNLAEDGASQ
jgi:site-specific DNA recombinase